MKRLWGTLLGVVGAYSGPSGAPPVTPVAPNRCPCAVLLSTGRGVLHLAREVLLIDSVTTVVPIGHSRSTSSRGGVISVFARGFNVLATGGGCTDFIVYGKYFHLGTPVSMSRFGDCRGVQPLRTGRLVYSLLIVQIWATCWQGVAQIGRSGVELFATFWGIHGEFGTP